MNRLVLWGIFGVLLIAATGVLVATAEPKGTPFITGDQPVTEAQVRDKMTSEGWTNVQIAREGRIFQVIGTKDGQSSRLMVDSQSGRLAGEDDDD